MKIRIVLTDALLVVALLALAAGTASAQTKWRLLRDVEGPAEACVEVRGKAVAYHLLDAAAPTTFRVHGPRRLKIVTRYLYAADEPDSASYALSVDLNGVVTEVLTHETRPWRHADPCGAEGRVGSLRRGYVSVPSGDHRIRVTARAPGGGAVAARFLRDVRRHPARWAAFAPERYAAVRHLQFDSGSRTAYYVLESATPVSWRVMGPTTLEVWTRLDFDHTMSGAQPYALEVRLDGEPLSTHQFDAEKLDAAVWVERPDVLPGSRRTLKVQVPAGGHRVELRCLRPTDCRVAVRGRIPERDVR